MFNTVVKLFKTVKALLPHMMFVNCTVRADLDSYFASRYLPNFTITQGGTKLHNSDNGSSFSFGALLLMQ